MRWTLRCWVMALVLPATVIVGCMSRALPIHPRMELPARSEPIEPPPATVPTTTHPAPTSPAVPGVRTIRDPQAAIRLISLSECIALALENGRVGDTPLRVLLYDPAMAGAAVDYALSRFDAIWQTSMNWETLDEPVGVAAQTALTQQNSLNLQRAELNSRLIKPLPTGGVTSLSLNTEYEFGDLNSPVNPAYRPRLVFGFEQPLLQGAGVTINQLRESHPGAVTLPFLTRGNGPGILLARVQFDQSRAKLVAQVQDLLLQVEQAYWQLYAAYWNLYSREIGLKQAYQAWMVGKEQFKAGELTAPDLAQLEAQYFAFRVQRMDALGNGTGRPGVLEAERQLRQTIGLAAEDGYQLVPCDAPTEAAYLPCWQTAQSIALSQRPELHQARQEVKQAELRVRRANDYLLPDLRFGATYDINALGSRLDGPGDQNALRNLAANNFNNWTLGLRLEVPIGFREAHSRVRIEMLRLAQQIARLNDQEQQAVLSLQRSYRELLQAQDRIPLLRARRQALAQQYQGQFELFKSGEAGQLNVLLEAQRNWVESLREEQDGLVRYANALADFERQKGTLLEHDNVTIIEGELPNFARQRAEQYIQQRENAWQLRTRPVSASNALKPQDAMTPAPLVEWLRQVPTLNEPLTPGGVSGVNQESPATMR